MRVAAAQLGGFGAPLAVQVTHLISNPDGVPTVYVAVIPPSGRTAMCGLSARSLPLIFTDGEQEARSLRQAGMSIEGADALAAET